MNEQEAKAIVLEWLKRNPMNHEYPIELLKALASTEEYVPSPVVSAYHDLNSREEYELLAEFAEWGLKEGAKG